MNEAVQEMQATLSGGRGPACWTRELGSLMARVRQVEWACSKSLGDEIKPPRLTDGQPFDLCADALMSACARPETDDSPTPAPIRAPEDIAPTKPPRVEHKPYQPQAPKLPRRDRVAQPAGGEDEAEPQHGKRERQARPDWQPETICPPEEVTALPPHADFASLCQWAGEEIQVPARTATYQPEEPRRPDLPPMPEPESQAPRERLHDWFEDVACRAEQRVEQTAAHEFQALERGTLQTAWAEPLAEPGATLDVIERARDGLKRNSATPATTSPRPAQHERLKQLSGQPELEAETAETMRTQDMMPLPTSDRQPLGDVAQRDALDALEPPYRADMIRPDRQPPALQSPFGPLVGPLRTGGPDRPPAATPQVTPPGRASLMPSLETPRTVDAPIPPVATLTSWQGARDEAEPTEADDLYKLAEKIRRILEEDARRHGIDV